MRESSLEDSGRHVILRFSQTRLTVRDEVGSVLDEYLPDEAYDRALFAEKRDKVLELTLDLAINHRKWAA